MPRWNIHKRWDCKFEISPAVSDYIAKAIDSKSPSDKTIPMPDDFRRHTLERKIPRSRGGDISIADVHSYLHDRARSRFVQEEDLKFLLQKGGEYVRAYYLHFILDYLDHGSVRDWVRVTGDSVEDCIERYKKNKAVCIPQTQKALTEVIDFLKNHAEDIRRDLTL